MAFPYFSPTLIKFRSKAEIVIGLVPEMMMNLSSSPILVNQTKVRLPGLIIGRFLYLKVLKNPSYFLHNQADQTYEKYLKEPFSVFTLTAKKHQASYSISEKKKRKTRNSSSIPGKILISENAAFCNRRGSACETNEQINWKEVFCNFAALSPKLQNNLNCFLRAFPALRLSATLDGPNPEKLQPSSDML